MAGSSSASLQRILTADALGHHVVTSSSSYNLGKSMDRSELARLLELWHRDCIAVHVLFTIAMSVGTDIHRLLLTII